MKISEVDNMLKKILEIDKNAIKSEGQIALIDETKEKELKKELKKIEQTKMRETRKLARTKYEEILNETKAEVELIKQGGEMEKERLKNVMEKNEKMLLENAFKELFKGSDFNG